MFYVYILYNGFTNKYYTGHTRNITNRLEKHNRKGSPYTSRVKGKWKLVHQEAFVNKKDALLRERQIKRHKSRQYIENLINQAKLKPGR